MANLSLSIRSTLLMRLLKTLQKSTTNFVLPIRGEMVQWLEREFSDWEVRCSNPTSASRLSLSRFGQPGSIPTLVLPSGGMAARHRKGVTAERFFIRVHQSSPECAAQRLPDISVGTIFDKSQ
ncbi:hypothetical protein CSKR_110347 [Clonorchis sinensis]|uniref:Uncharacterized protein n=1 Tax=Clonorchis sinensis TaxID=79923 RepID=A0A419QFM8_CLOSI|nr:hypothetical protein CSKR_110347 [Clonorchis sinensis]